MTGRRNGILAALPFAAAFFIAPLAARSAGLAGSSALLQGIGEGLGPQGLGLWLGLAGVAAFCGRQMAGAGGIRRGRSPRVPLLLAAMAAAVWLWLRFLAPLLAGDIAAAPCWEALRLPALIGFAWLWVRSFGGAGRLALARLGAGLGCLTLLDFILTSLLEHRLVLGGGLLFGAAAGTADITAFLLCLAYCATLDQERTDGGNPGGPFTRWLILAGLIATFSRSGLATAAAVCLCHDGAPGRERACIATACIIGIWLSLTLPLPHVPAFGEELGIPWYWAATFEALHRNPAALLTGLPFDVPMALAMPDIPGDGLIPELDGLPVFVFQIPVSILRLTAAWGILAPLAIFAGAGWCARRSRSHFGAGVFTAVLAGSLFGPVLHVAATAAVAALALFSAAAPRRSREAEDAPQRPTAQPAESSETTAAPPFRR